MLMFQCYGLCGGAVGLSWATMEVKLGDYGGHTGWSLQCFGVGATQSAAGMGEHHSVLHCSSPGPSLKPQGHAASMFQCYTLPLSAGDWGQSVAK